MNSPDTNTANAPAPSVEYASFYLRVMASLVDTLLSTLLLYPFAEFFVFAFSIQMPSQEIIDAMKAGTATPEQMLQLGEFFYDRFTSSSLQLIVLSVVVLLFWFSKSATPGKMLFRMRIVDAKTLGKPSKGQLVGRFFGYIVSTLPVCLGFLWIYFDKKRRGFHDLLAGTAVIREPREKRSDIAVE